MTAQHGSPTTTIALLDHQPKDEIGGASPVPLTGFDASLAKWR